MKVEEPAPERFLYGLWNDEVLGSSLQTVGGRRLEVVFKGTRNLDAGPDFKNATIVVDGEMRRGDVEIHPVAADWYHHGHHEDPRYNSVILHVVTMDAGPEAKTRRQDGEYVPVLNLDDFLSKPSEQLAEESEAEVPVVKSEEHCSLRSMASSKILQVIELAGDERFSVKCQRFAEERTTDSWDQILYRGIAEALGYSKNQVQFRKLADQVPVAEIWRFIRGATPEQAVIRSQACLFGASGLLQEAEKRGRASVDGETQEFLSQLRSEWDVFPHKRKIDPLKPEEWLFFRLRPQNFPTHRIAGLAWLVVRFASHGFLESPSRTLRSHEGRSKILNKELVRSVTVSATDFWVHHYCFDPSRLERVPQGTPKLVGRDRAMEIVANVILPCLSAYAEETEDRKLKNVLREVYAQSPLCPDNIVTRSMGALLFSDERARLVETGRHQQGLIHLHRTLCTSTDCDHCLQHYQV